MRTLLVNRKNFSDIALVNVDDAPLQDGEVRVSIGPWALTANNITYMVTGDQIGYWKFFEPKDYDIDMDGYGRMPVWGYGEVIESCCDEVTKGIKLYGFFPVAERLVMRPGRHNPLGFQDIADHRAALHPVYNSYNFVDKDPGFAAHREVQPVLRPLFTTSFLIDDFLADENFFGAEQVLLLSASSKTAMGTAFCLKQRGGITVSGLTSSGNKAFVEASGFYDRVQSYDDITALDAGQKTVIVDLAGNGKVMAAAYDHFGENIVYNCMVGKSHWQGSAPPKNKTGAPPVMFFAPDRARLRMQEWGGAGFAKNLASRWLPFCESAKSWLNLENSDKMADMLKTYKAFLDGEADPAQGYLFTLTEA